MPLLYAGFFFFPNSKAVYVFSATIAKRQKKSQISKIFANFDNIIKKNLCHALDN